LVALGHPNPRNAPATVPLPTQTVPQNFSKFDTNSNLICSGATTAPNYNNHPCAIKPVFVNDGCPAVGAPETQQCSNNTNDDPGGSPNDTKVNDGCPQVGAAPETGAQCDNSLDDDLDGKVNDGCPAVGPAESEQCSNKADDDIDSSVNDGCPTVGLPESVCTGNVDDDPANDKNVDCACNSPPVCPTNDAAHNGVCGNPPTAPLVACTAAGESVPPTRGPSPPSGQGGCARWVGKPATFREAQEQPTWGGYRAARLQCTPFYYDWVTETAGNVCAGPLGPYNTGLPCTTNTDCTSSCSLKKCSGSPANTCTGVGQGNCPNGGQICEFVSCFTDAECTAVSAGTCDHVSVTCKPKKLTVVGAEILPSSTYSVRTYGSVCEGNEGLCSDLGTPVTMLTRRHGDVGTPYRQFETTGEPGAGDVGAIVAAYGKAGPLRQAGARIVFNVPEQNADLDATDIGRVVNAVKGYAYEVIETGPCPCPSTVTCGTPCTNDAGPSSPQCGGGGAQCVKTCTGGVNDGLTCRDNTHGHCPGGTCGSGFCRDKCGRCAP
jgi:hypothetical protein